MKTINTLASNQVTLSNVQLKETIEQLNQLSTDELVNVYIDYADQNSYERIYNLDESTINELYSSPWQALYDSNHKDFNDMDYFFTYNGNGHMVSFSNEDDDNCPIDIEELAQWIVDNELFDDYDIDVTTLDDMLASIEDNITDDEDMFLEICRLLSLKVKSVENAMSVLVDYNYKQLLIVITHLGINYK